VEVAADALPLGTDPQPGLMLGVAGGGDERPDAARELQQVGLRALADRSHPADARVEHADDVLAVVDGHPDQAAQPLGVDHHRVEVVGDARVALVVGDGDGPVLHEHPAAETAPPRHLQRPDRLGGRLAGGAHGEQVGVLGQRERGEVRPGHGQRLLRRPGGEHRAVEQTAQAPSGQVKCLEVLQRRDRDLLGVSSHGCHLPW
jgi:hypothetical protein